MKNKFSVFSHSGDGCKSILRNENDVKCISEQDPNQTMSRGKAHRVINALTQMIYPRDAIKTLKATKSLTEASEEVHGGHECLRLIIQLPVARCALHSGMQVSSASNEPLNKRIFSVFSNSPEHRTFFSIYFCCSRHIWPISKLNIGMWFVMTHFASLGFFFLYEKKQK